MTSTHRRARLHVIDRGEGDVLVFLHGSGGCVVDWDPQLDALADGFRVVAIDQRGFGASEAVTDPIPLSEYATDVVGVLDGLGIETAVLIGLSLGGSVALQVAVDAPERVAGLVVADATSFVPPEVAEMMIASTGSIAEQGMAANVRLMRPLIFAKGAIDADASYIRAYEERFATGDTAAMASAGQAVARMDLHRRLGDITVPTLVIVGAEDQLLPVPVSEGIAAAIPGARLEVIEGASHISNLDQPEEFTRLVRELAAGKA